MGEIKGRIHSFESFGTVDGPGIRFVVFMQGCPLRCLYCHNRDTWDINGGKEYTPSEVISEALKYEAYIKASNGGITISGGEPTLQADFVAEVFKLAKMHQLHTALDTSGFADIDKVEKLLGFTDLVLLDIKHTDGDKHKRLTGVSREKIVKFARHLTEKGIEIWIRYVLVPGYTDDLKDLENAAAMIRELKTVTKVEVLPYHSMGAYKWDKMGKKYPLSGVQPPSQDEVERAKKILIKK